MYRGFGEMNIIEQAIPQPIFNDIKTEIFSNNFPWFFVDSTTYGDDKNNLTEIYSFFHTAIKNGKRNSPLADMIIMPILMALGVTTEKSVEIFRIRLGLITPKTRVIVHGPHVDQWFDHMSALLYLNDCNGDTYFYNEYYDPKSNMSSNDYYKKVLNSQMTIQKLVAPKENTLVCFDGFQYHSSSTPTDVARRVVVNINYAVK